MPAFSSRAPGALENNDKEKLERFSNEISPGTMTDLEQRLFFRSRPIPDSLFHRVAVSLLDSLRRG